MFSLLRGFLLTSSPSLFTLNLKSAFSFQRSFGGKFAWEIVPDSPIVNFVSQTKAYSGTLTRHEIVRANASLGELRRDKEKLSSPISCEFVRVKAS